MRVAGMLEREVAPRPLALVRIVIGLSALGLAVLVERERLQGLAAEGIFHAPATSVLPGPDPALMDAILILWIGFAIALAIGLFARVAAAGVAAAVGAAILLDLQTFSNHLALLLALSALLALANPGAAWSLDARLRGPRATIPYWPIFLVKTQISTLYAFAALTKLNGSFLGGEVFATPWRQNLNELVSPLGDVVFVGAAISTVLLEGFLAVALWSERLRKVALPLGLAFHVSIVLSIGFGPLIFFGAMVLATYVLFPEFRPGSRVVVWDEGCAFCSRFVAGFRRLDWFGVHEFAGTAAASPGDSGDRADAAIRITGEGERADGYHAIRIMLDKSPVTFLVAPVLALPPLAALGRRAYRRAVSRPRYEPESARA